MSLYRDQLLYMNRSFSQTYISDLTGIPQSTLSYVLSDQRELPSKYEPETQYQYSQVAYSNLLGAGANRYAAIQSSVAAPDQVIDEEYRWQKVVYNLAYYRIAREGAQQGVEYTDEYIKSLIPNYIPGVINSYHKLSVDLKDAENNVWYVPQEPQG